MHRSPLTFFLLTFAASWACFFAALALVGGSTFFSIAQAAILLLGTIAPSLVAIAVTAYDEGRAGVAALLRPAIEFRGTGRWYVFAVGYMAAIKLTVAIAHRLIAGAWPALGTEPLLLIAVAIVISTPVQAGEEIGWRGYGLPRLAARMGFGPAGVLLGVIWAVWHLPIFYLPGADKFGQSFPAYLLAVTPLSVAMTWLYVNTGRSVLLTMLMHSAVNQTIGIVPSTVEGSSNPLALSPSLASWLTVAWLWIPAVYFLVRMRRPREGRT